jgi:hypothetical protein
MWNLKITSTVTDSQDPDKIFSATLSITSGVKAVRLVQTTKQSGAAVITDNELTTFVVVCESRNDAIKLVTDFTNIAETRHAESHPEKPITLHIKNSQYCEYN